MGCPVCGSQDLFASHRKGLLERGPISWVGVFPYRCGECQTRFYRWTGTKGRRRRSGASSESVEHVRPARWRHVDEVAVQLMDGDRPSAPVVGESTNVSLEGVGLRLPTPLQEGKQVSVALKGGAVRTGTVRWMKVDEKAGYAHGVQLDSAFEQRGRLAKPWRRMRRRQMVRRLGLLLGGLLVMAGLAWSLIWAMDVFHAYDPKYYEPKDIERQQHEAEPGSGKGSSTQMK